MATPTTSGPVSGVPLSGNSSIDALVGGTKWGGPAGAGVAVLFSFPYGSPGPAYWSTDPITGYGATSGPGEPWDSFGLSPVQQAAFRSALQQWERVANITFTETADNQSTVGDIRVAFTNNFADPPLGAYAYFPSGTPIGGDIWLDANDYWTLFDDVDPGSYGFLTLLHEIGHALGLKHPFEDGVVLPSSSDEVTTTVMSYTAAAGYPDSGLSFYPTTPMWYDIMALQYIYGPNMSYHSGNDTYVFNANWNYSETIWDAGGIDTIQYVSEFRGGWIDLRAGHWNQLGLEQQIFTSSGTLATSDTVIIYGTVTIENAIGGSGPDTIIGNDVANQLMGADGNDTITGGPGNDTLVGGTGNDTLDGEAGLDVAVFEMNRAAGALSRAAWGSVLSGPEGTDTLTDIERLRFSDRSLAFDLDRGEAAGNTVRLIGAAFGTQYLTPDTIGSVLDIFDSGYTLAGLSPVAITVMGSPGNADFVETIFRNVVGFNPSPDLQQSLVNLLESGAMTQAQMLEIAANLEINEAHIGLVGMQENGVEFV